SLHLKESGQCLLLLPCLLGKKFHRSLILSVFQLLWGGIEIMANETIKVEDEELATLRPAKRLLWIFQHKVPKNPSGIEEYLDHFSQSDTPITPEEFELLVFTTIFTAYQIRLVQGLDKNLWINLFSQLVNEILRELCKQFCPEELTDSVQHLASRPWQEMPSHVSALKKFYQPSFVMTQGN
uniref:Family with sequence similarity 180 member B n=1 Tax=Pseudonaja textilis TaxID=8673 RepID=A0A670Z0N7_PSETE